MKRLSVPIMIAAALLAACGTKTDQVRDPGGSTAPTAIPSVSIGECQTKQGAEPPATAKGVDWKTQLSQPGKLLVGSDNAYPPFEEIKPGAKKPVGFDVDLYTEVAQRLGITTVSTTTDFDGLFTQSVPTGKFDLGVSAITIKESRKKTVDFTVPYFRSDLSLAINKEKTPTISTIDDLAGKTVGVQKGTTGETCGQALVKQGKVKQIKSYGDSAQAFQDLVAGRTVAVINDQPASEGFIEKNAALAVVQVLTTQEEYGFAISKDKPDLRVKIDETMAAIMSDGTYATVYKKWFGTAPPFAVPLR